MFQKLALASTLTALVGTAAISAPVAFDSKWQQQRFSLFQQNTYGFGGKSLSLSSDGSVSLTYRPLDTALWSSEKASWNWAVTQGVPPTDLRKKGGDDRDIALYFVFLPQDEAQRLQGQSIRRVLGSSQARVLVYVWGGAHKRGSVLASPYLDTRGKTVVLRPAGTGSARENVDLKADFARAFGGQSGALVGLAVSGDSDDTDSRIRATISNLTLN